MEKTISVRRTTITFSIWDLGGQREFVNMLPLVCNDAIALLFMFDLTRKSTLNSVKEWYRQARGFNKVSSLLICYHSMELTGPSLQTAIPFLIGTKFDTFASFPRDEQEEVTKQVSPNPLARWYPEPNNRSTGKAIRKSHACIIDLLLHVCIDQRAEDLQDCACESV